MRKHLLIGINIAVVCVLSFTSLSSIVSVQMVQSMNIKVIKDEVDQKELLFQTLVDIAHNKEIQQIILKYQINRGGFFTPEGRHPLFSDPVITKKQLKQIYTVGLALSKTLSKSKIHTMVEQHQVNNQEMQQEISAVFEKNEALGKEIAQLSDLTCDCEKGNTTAWHYPIICTLLLPFFIIFLFLSNNTPAFIFDVIDWIIEIWGEYLVCFWSF